jgi:hypothetical protein
MPSYAQSRGIIQAILYAVLVVLPSIPLRAYLAASASRDLERVILSHLRLLDFGRLLDVSSRELLTDLLSP